MGKKFVVTSVTAGFELNKPALKALQGYCKRNKASLILVETLAKGRKDTLSEEIPKDSILKTEKYLNSNLKVSNIRLSPGQSAPNATHGQSIIFGGTLLQFTPSARVGGMPVYSYSTGSICYDNYADTVTGFRKTSTHTLSALIIEIKNSKTYFVRPVEIDTNGSFIDLGIQYFASGKTQPVYAKAITGGDIHAAQSDLTAIQGLISLQKLVRAKELMIGDVFDGSSINHHNEYQVVTKSRELLSLQQEGVITSKLLNRLTKHFDKVSVCASNHHDWLTDYLDEVKFRTDSLNVTLAAQLFADFVSGKDPIECLLRKTGVNKKVRFLTRDDSNLIEGIITGLHTDQGPNGSRGSPSSLARLGEINGQHTHVPRILGGLWDAGCLCKLRQSYNSGPSSWAHGAVVVYPGGSRQLIIFVGGEFRV